jgi:2-[(L-alanin-3-ylcarbamoyl)methyl]-2-hydroxybutanedioate decarboxylase
VPAQVTGPLPQRVVDALLATAPPRCAYVYDRITLARTAERVRAALPETATLLYAVKANGHPDVLAALSSTVDGYEVASGGELALARIARAGVGRASQIVMGGPGKTDAELAAAVEAGVTVNVESATELRRLAVAAETAGVRVPVGVRVNRRDATVPGTRQMTGVATPFGIDESQLAEALEVAWGHPALRVTGFALHAVSNNLDAAAHLAFVDAAVRWSLQTAQRFGLVLDHINVGGGFGVAYTAVSSDAPGFDLDLLADGLNPIASRLPPGVRLVFELGRFLAADAGWYGAEVLDLKSTHGRWFAVLRGGTHHFRLPAAWGYSHPFTVVPVDPWLHPYERPELHDAPVDAVGELCTPRDVLSRDQRVDRVRVGDMLVFSRTGAYGWDISHHDFLHHPPPEFLVTG